jgi:hypothetical protein
MEIDHPQACKLTTTFELQDNLISNKWKGLQYNTTSHNKVGAKINARVDTKIWYETTDAPIKMIPNS